MSLKFVDKRRLYISNLLRRTSNQYNAPIWRRVRELIMKPRRRRISVNISKLNRYTKEGDIVVVPGKVIGSGYIDHKIIVGAYSFSLTARNKLVEAGCEVMKIEELVNKYPDGKGVKIIT